MIKIIIAMIIFSLILISLLFVGIATLLTGDIKATLYIIGKCFRTCILKKEREKYIDTAYISINKAFKVVCQIIVEKKNKELSKILKIDSKNANKFKNEIQKILNQKDFEFLTHDEIKQIVKIEKMLNPFLMIRRMVLVYASPEWIDKFNFQQNTNQMKFNKMKEKIFKVDKINLKNDGVYMYNKLFA